MTHLIDKSALVAEIEKFEKALKNACKPNPFGNVEECMTAAELQALDVVKEAINTLEMKEADYERELSKYVSNGIHRFFPNEGDDYYNMDSVVWQDYVIETAKHFFELGLKAQIMTSKLQQRISVLKMSFWTGLQTFEETEMTLSDAYNQGVDDILEELGLKAQKGDNE